MNKSSFNTHESPRSIMQLNFNIYIIYYNIYTSFSVLVAVQLYQKCMQVGRVIGVCFWDVQGISEQKKLDTQKHDLAAWLFVRKHASPVSWTSSTLNNVSSPRREAWKLAHQNIPWHDSIILEPSWPRVHAVHLTIFPVLRGFEVLPSLPFSGGGGSKMLYKFSGLLTP